MRLVFALWSLLVGVYGDEVFEFYGDSHFEFGRQMGLRFRDKIQDRMRLNSKLQTLLLPFAKTSTGRKLLDRYLLTHRTRFPQYVEELEGVAEGSDVSFETIFIENIVEEFSNSIPPSFQSDVFSTEARHPVLRCSDIVLSSSEMHVVAHNEDSGEVDVNRTAIVIAKIADEPKFVAYTYLGDLPSGAFGFNQNGVAFTLNFVQPSEIFVGGLGRGFISRDLLTAKNANDATAIITREGQAAGHNFQLMDVPAKRMWNIEVASFNRHIVYEFKEEGNAISAFFHANQYQRLQIAQPPYQSSLHRLQRYNELTPPTTIDEALVVLGDQEDRSWPVFHDHLSHARGDLSGWTLTTIVFDLDKGKAVSFLGNPAHCRQNLVWDLSNVTMLSAAPN
ncbi:hypothetical protein PC129_g14300 [Phytophthora cactorum]|uniref:Peptidase C45 hydrolase domain-containing protein n=1 Tax=Phytophthora cactorum TaxID=29920 RepID=A0A329RPH6_9STRA|nr:hypothetical protein Pcac1_g13909 [Phytophthora cactorum]KAG2807860.1 hypothetical protein PC112_g17225 [Phytophthora cactorum]KAG2809479.1 hypothetical protein PC111_g16045 [Phytophthora cactorum]KAG2851300.1 hypothetical protein PC113_g16038 [Phytophthora cactorum]KAG2890253.1 hypothetical protein PC114_g17564 [Phytophthora cactorum]